MNPNQPDPMSEEEIGHVLELGTLSIGGGLCSGSVLGKLCATALRAISLERTMADVRAEFGPLIECAFNANARADVLERENRELRELVEEYATWEAGNTHELAKRLRAALAKPRTAGGEENENG